MGATPLVTDLRVAAHMSWGMWVATCPRYGCGNAEKRGRCDDGTWGGLEADRFTCRQSHGGCGLRCDVDWPHNIRHLEALLLARPVPATRNWAPGETLHDLLRENLTHGIVPTGMLEGGPSRPLLEILGDEITVGSLESAPRPLEISGA